MHSNQYPYWELHDAMVSLPGDRLSPRLLAEWLQQYPKEATWLEWFRQERGHAAAASQEELWRLYALSRVVEVMNLSFQTGDADSWTGPGFPASDVAAFARDLGLSVVVPDRYTAFDCEIAAVTEAADDTAPADLVDVQWPCLMLGEMLICRAGATLRAGARVMNPQIASSSTLYWAYRRRNRPHADLSHGWGHNSQWRTSFRRDYRVGQRTYYNVDGEHDLLADDPGVSVREEPPLTRLERVELLVNRCFVVTSRPGNDLWPYDDRLATSDGP